MFVSSAWRQAVISPATLQGKPMNCSVCDSKTRLIFAEYPSDSSMLGQILVPGTELVECFGCGSRSLSSASANEISSYIGKLEECAITSLPASDFITAGQAAAILGVSKQAFSKNPKIKKGLVYYLTIGAKRYYLKSSVELFKAKGDGRFRLTQWRSSKTGNRVPLSNTTICKQETRWNVEDTQLVNLSWNTCATG